MLSFSTTTKIEPYDESHLWRYVGQRGVLLSHAGIIVIGPPQLLPFCPLIMFILNTVKKLQ